MKFSNFIFYLAAAGWLVWFLYAYLHLLDSSVELLLLYSCFLGLGITMLFRVRKDIFSPIGLITIVCYQTFGMSIPFLASEEVLIYGNVLITDAMLVKVVAILLVAYIGFVFGASVSVSKFLPVQSLLGGDRLSRKVSSVSFILLSIVVGVAALLRVTLHLGEVGVQPTVPYAGYFQYALYNGVQLACLWYLAQGLRQGKLFTFLGLSLLLGLAATQVLLGWRGGIIHTLILVVLVFWYRLLLVKGRSMAIWIWLIALLLVIPMFIQAGNAVRAEKMGGEILYADSTESFVSKFLSRAQGATRLAAVANLVGPLTLTNDFMLFDLMNKELSTTKYVDRVVYGIEPAASNSVGTSGPGGPYLGMGMIGVILVYFALGMIYRMAYDYLQRTKGENPLAIAWYATMVYALFGALSENVNMNTFKLVWALILFNVLLSYVVLRVKGKCKVVEEPPQTRLRGFAPRSRLIFSSTRHSFRSEME